MAQPLTSPTLLYFEHFVQYIIHFERLPIKIIVSVYQDYAANLIEILLCIITCPFDFCEQNVHHDTSTRTIYRNHGWSVLAQCSKLNAVLEVKYRVIGWRCQLLVTLFEYFFTNSTYQIFLYLKPLLFLFVEFLYIINYA